MYLLLHEQVRGNQNIKELINPLLSLEFEPSIEGLGDSYWDEVKAANFPLTKLRFRNDALLKELGINASAIKDIHFEEAYGKFSERFPLLALRYHGYQFGTYNPFLGDGRGFLYGQLRDRHGNLRDLGTKGSGTTPWSRGGDGRLTLKGGVREIIASEALHRLGTTTSRTLSLIETGEDLFRGDEPSPTRSSVMVRVAQTHLRFGTCERLLYLREPLLLQRLLLHTIAVYYPSIANKYPITDQTCSYTIEKQILAFYAELVERVARLAAEWMAAGFTHGVLNTDNMSLTGESFDYGPFAFIENWDPSFTAAYFDQTGLYAFGQQPSICYSNLKLLQEPLLMILSREDLEERLEKFANTYKNHYQTCMNRRLGLANTLTNRDKKSIKSDTEDLPLIENTLKLLSSWGVHYGKFFSAFSNHISTYGLPEEAESLLPFMGNASTPSRKTWLEWRDSWWMFQHLARSIDPQETTKIPQRLVRWNLPQTPIRSVIEDLWESIDQEDNWEPLKDWLQQVIVD